MNPDDLYSRYQELQGYVGWNPGHQHVPPPPEGTAGPEPHELNPLPPEESDDDER